MTETAALPRYLTVKQVGESLGYSDDTVRRIFWDYPGVLKIAKGPETLRGKRKYVALRIPESALRSYISERANR